MRQIPDMPTTLESGNASTCCFVTKKTGCARRFPGFFQHFRNDDSTSGFYQQRRHPRQHPVVVETSKGRCRKTEHDPSLSSPHVESTTTASLTAQYPTCAAIAQPNKKIMQQIFILNQSLITAELHPVLDFWLLSPGLSCAVNQYKSLRALIVYFYQQHRSQTHPSLQGQTFAARSP